jgi:hypothetical protein
MEVVMKKLRFGAVLVWLMIGPLVLAQSDSPPEFVTIDGSKHPEQVPNWAAWLEAFRFMAGPDTHDVPIPTTVYRVTSRKERYRLRREALTVIAAEREMNTRATDVFNTPRTPETLPELQAQMNALEMTVRRAALDARDRVLPTLEAAGQQALLEFVDQMRKGFRATVPKSELAQFRLPE